MKPRWLSRSAGIQGPYLTLCTSQAEFAAVLSSIKYKGDLRWLKSDRADATTHHLYRNGVPTCIVCLGDTRDRNSIEIAGLLVHEAVHVWQEHCESIGEDKPGREMDAYGVQAIAQELMSEYKRRVAAKESRR